MTLCSEHTRTGPGAGKCCRFFKPWAISCIAILCLACLVWAGGARGQEPMRLGGFDYPPFYFKDGEQVKGIAADLVSELFSRLDTLFSLEFLPLERALRYAREGQIDGIMILIKTAARSEFLAYTDPVMTVRGLIWSAADRKGGPVNFERLEDLRPYVMGVTIGYSYGQELDDLIKTMTTEPVTSDYINYKKLAARRIDIFPGNEIVAKGLFKRYPEFRGRFVHSDRSFIQWDLHMGISKKSSLAIQIPVINRILSDFRTQGVVEAVVRKYTE